VAVPPDGVHRRAGAGGPARPRRPHPSSRWWAQALGRAAAGPAGRVGRAGRPRHPRDPESPLRWTCKSTRELADALGAQGFQVSDDTVGRLLKQQRCTLQRTLKTEEGAQHPDRDAQFRYLNDTARGYLDQGLPVVSVDTKKKGSCD
jgi:Rhodopirellula transposase DDE domain